MNEVKNTDKEIWREIDEDYYSPSIHVTKQGDIGIDVGGHVIVQSVREWHKLQAKLNKYRWIPVMERPPEKSGQVWICYEITGYTYQAYYDVEYKKWGIFDPCGGFSDIDFSSPPTHWKPIIPLGQTLKGEVKCA